MKELTAYIVAEAEAGDELARELRDRLKAKLPDYMIPAVFHREDVLPKNPNGKVDRRFLAQKYLHEEAAKGSVNK